ncbi:ABC transporter permease [Bradyrhizobium sp. 200]|uniref:ABC transporter permease n=1 Tax=Bradyrhizobium sp. 200 TaxID=2782665 RepID=UPI001FFFFD6C|nr:ABC transporter permease [Bradyrhizobium sp. 200]UPJ47891.1 ABC transporter permease [Bradyrhizobium sp. 200]
MADLELVTSSAVAAAGHATRRRNRRWLLAFPALAFLAMFFGVPLLQNAARSLGLGDYPSASTAITLAHYQKMLADPYYLGVIFETLKVSSLTTAFCLLIGYPVAYVMVRMAGRLAVPLLFLLITPLLTSIIMRTFGWRVLFARRGVINDFLMQLHVIDQPLPILSSSVSVYIGMIHVLVPFMVLSIVPVLQGVDRRLEDSARVLGAGAVRTFFTVTLPLTLEGIATGCVLVFMLANGSFVTMLLLGDGNVVTLPLLIFQQFTLTHEIGLASAMSNLLLLIVLVCLYAQLRLARLKEA